MTRVAWETLVDLRAEMVRRCVPQGEIKLALERAIASIEGYLERARAPEPADRWEYARTLDYSLGNLDVCGAEGWEAYAAAFNSDGKQVIWMKRRLG